MVWRCLSCSFDNSSDHQLRCAVCAATRREKSEPGHSSAHACVKHRVDADPLSCSDEQFLNHCLHSQEPKLFEVLFVLQKHRALLAVEENQRLLQQCRLDDDRLERAIVHRDEMRAQMELYQSYSALVHFGHRYRSLTHIPLLRQSTATSLCVLRARQLIAEAGGPTCLLADAQKLEPVLRQLQELCDVFEALCYTAVSAPPERLLQCALVDLCRIAEQWCCVPLSGPAGGPSMATCSDVQRIAAHNAQVLVKDQDALNGFVQTLSRLLSIAKQTTMSMVSEEVRAKVSLLLAELMALFDHALPNSAILCVTVDRVSNGQCRLTGAKTADSSVLHGKAVFPASQAAAVYWAAVTEADS